MNCKKADAFAIYPPILGIKVIKMLADIVQNNFFLNRLI